jgi:hypothetical protein
VYRRRRITPTVSLDTWEIVSEDEEEDTLELDGEW